MLDMKGLGEPFEVPIPLQWLDKLKSLLQLIFVDDLSGESICTKYITMPSFLWTVPCSHVTAAFL
jgi:hypothetical protein